MHSSNGMRLFSELFTGLDQTTSTSRKVDLLSEYFKKAEDKDKLWAIALLSHKRPKRTVKTTLLREWTQELTSLPEWLFEESYHVVGDLAETIALLLGPAANTSDHSLTYWINFIRDLENLDIPGKRQGITEAWDQLNESERFLFNKIITGGFRVGVARKTVVKALAQLTGKEESHMAHRLIGHWHPDETTFDELILEEHIFDDLSKPYPFLLAYPIEEEVETLGDPHQFQIEYKWDGIRGQLIHRKGQLFVWSRGEELVTDRYPEYQEVANALKNDVALDGEILAFRDGQPMPFQKLQKRIGRKRVGKKTLSDIPVIFMAYDIMEFQGEDIRSKPLKERRKILEKVISDAKCNVLTESNVIDSTSWEDLKGIREEARKIGAEGLMVKKLDSTYETGRKRGLWWKWKVDPMTIDAVMLYAMRGHGRRSGLYSDLTFAVWDGEDLVPFAKAYSGLTDEELKEVTRFVNKNTRERFGPVRSVNPELVFELAFEGIMNSTRHKSGVALRFPRIKRWRKDKKATEANTLKDLKSLLQAYRTD